MDLRGDKLETSPSLELLSMQSAETKGYSVVP